MWVYIDFFIFKTYDAYILPWGDIDLPLVGSD